MSALYRIAFGEHDRVRINARDVVVLSSSAIPGNEKLIGKIINSLVRGGVKVVHDSAEEVHVSGHACREEIKLMLALLRPKYFMPIHGEYRHLYANKEIAEFMGIPSENIFVSEIGKVLEIDKSSAGFNGTIPAGKVSANIEVEGLYDNIEPTDSLGFTLQLVMPEALKWDLYPESNRTKVVMFKSCPFDINEWGGTEQDPRYCLLTSQLLLEYPGTNTSYSRLVRCYKHKSLENTIVMDDLFYDGYDVNLTFDTKDPSKPLLILEDGQVIGDEYAVFGIAWGDGKILAQTTPATSAPSTFNSCQKFASLYVRVYVNDFSTLVGYVGDFYNILEWLSKEEAEDLMKEGV
jgi:hypothetical protein